MSLVDFHALEGPDHRLRRLLIAAAVAAGATVVGVFLGVLGDMGGPMLVIGLPGTLAVALAVLARPPIGVMAVYASFPIAFISVTTPFVEFQVIEVAVLLVTAAVALRRLGLGLVPLSWAGPMWWGMSIVTWAVIATPGAGDLEAALKQDAHLAVGLLFGLTVLTACRSIEDVRKVIMAFLVIGGLMAINGLRSAAELRSISGGDVVHNRLQGIFTHPNDLGAFAAILLMVAVGFTVGGRTRSARILGWAAAATGLAALMLTLSRGAWMGSVLGGFLLLVLVPQLRRTLITIGIPILLMATAVGSFRSTSPEVLLVRERVGTLVNPLDNPYDDRPSIWREAIREVREEPLTGMGPGNFPFTSARAGSVSQAVGAIHAHNTLLTVAAEVGLPGVLLVIGLTLALARTVVRTARAAEDHRDQALVAGIGAGLAIQIGQGVVDFNLRNPVLHMLMWSLVGLVLVMAREVRGEER